MSVISVREYESVGHAEEDGSTLVYVSENPDYPTDPDSDVITGGLSVRDFLGQVIEFRYIRENDETYDSRFPVPRIMSGGSPNGAAFTASERTYEGDAAPTLLGDVPRGSIVRVTVELITPSE